MKLQKTKSGYFCRYKGFFFVVWKKPHGAWACMLGRGNKYLASNGIHGTSMPTLKDVRAWVRDTILTKNFWWIKSLT